MESSHPFKPRTSDWSQQQMIYTHECKDDEIAYFKVDVNMIETGQAVKNYAWNYLGNA